MSSDGARLGQAGAALPIPHRAHGKKGRNPAPAAPLLPHDSTVQAWDHLAVAKARAKSWAITPYLPTCLACGAPMALRQWRIHHACVLALAAVA